MNKSQAIRRNKMYSKCKIEGKTHLLVDHEMNGLNKVGLLMKICLKNNTLL